MNPIRCRSKKFRNSFYPDAVELWNNLDDKIRNLPTLSQFKTSLLKLIRPDKKEIFDVSDLIGMRWLFQLRVGLSQLREHKKRHNFIDTPSNICECATNIESTKHFLLECPLYIESRIVLMNSINTLLISKGFENITNDQSVQFLLYGEESLLHKENQLLLNSTINLIK